MRDLSRAVVIVLVVLGMPLWAGGTAEPTSTAARPTLELSKVFYFGDVSDAPDMKQEFMDAFSAKFGVNLKMNLFARNNYMEKINLMMTSGELKGMALIFGPADVLKSRDDGTILPVDDILKNNPNWTSQPEAFRNLYKFYGQTWAVPQSWGGQMFMRSIRKDWLDKLGLALPTTTDALYQALHAFAYNDPDGNGTQDTYGLTAAGTWNLQDIFQAFDARLDDIGENSVTWDPNRNSWIDSMLNPGMVDALNWLQKAYAEKVLDPEVFTNQGSNMREKFWSGEYGSTFYWESFGFQADPIVQKNVSTAHVVDIPAVTGSLTKNVNVMVQTGPPWVLLKGTPNAEQMLTTFVNLFYANRDAALWSAYGIQDKYWSLRPSDSVVTQKIDPKTNQPFLSPGIMGRLPAWTGIQYMSVPDGPPDVVQQGIDGLNQMYALIDQGMKAKTIYVTPGSLDTPVSATYTKLHADITRVFNEVVAKVTLGQMTAQDGIAYYRGQMRSMGAQAVLQEANQAVGLKFDSFYTY